MVEGAQSAPQSTRYTQRQILIIMSGLMLGMLLGALDQTIVSTALPTITRDFHRPDLYSWVVTSYLLTATASTPLYGKLSDLYGRKRLFEAAIVIFLIGSVLSGQSQTMLELILFRGVQGLGAGGLLSLALAIVADVVPPQQRGRYQGYFGLVFGASSVLGPLVGGYLVDTASWRWVFYINLPLGAIALLVVERVLSLDHHRTHAKIDWLGATLLVAGVSLFLIGVQDFGESAQLTTSSVAWAVSGLALTALFIFWEARGAADAIVPMRLFRNDVFRISSSLSFLGGMVLFGAIIFLPRYIQQVKGVSPTLSGLRLLPLMGGLVVTSIVSGRLVSRLGRYQKFVTAGTILMTIGVAWLSFLRVDSNEWGLAANLLVVGCGVGFYTQLTLVATQNSVAPSDLGIATATWTFFRTLGGAVGSAVLGAILIARQRSVLAGDLARHGAVRGAQYAFTQAMDRTYAWAVPLGILTVGLSLFLRDVKLDGSDHAHANPDATAEASVVAPDPSIVNRRAHLRPSGK